MRTILPLIFLSALVACDPLPREGRAPAGRCPSGLTDCSGKCSALGVDNANCGACGTTCSTDQQCIAGRCESLRPRAPLGIDASAPSASPTPEGTQVASVACTFDTQCPQTSTCVVPVCSSGRCTAKARSCDDSNPATLDVCVDTVGCENKIEPSPLKVVNSCAGLPKSIVCGADGVNYYNPCSAHNSAQMQYATAPCRLVNTYCSDNTAACLKGTRCINHLCK